MVRVYNDNATADQLNSRGVIQSNKEGDLYYYMTTAMDENIPSRADSEFQKKVINAFGDASKIYSNQPGCMQDYFRRATRTVRYGDVFDQPAYKTVTGYQLAMQLISGSIDYKEGGYFSPDCFCLQPVDQSGLIMPVHGRLTLTQDEPGKYVYDEKKLLVLPDDIGGIKKNPFCSAIANPQMYGALATLQADFAIPRHYVSTATSCKIEDIKYPTMFIPINLKSEIPTAYSDIVAWDTNNWAYFPHGDCLAGCPDTCSSCFTMLFLPRGGLYDLCGDMNLAVEVAYDAHNLYIDCICTDSPPFYTLMFGGHSIGRVGAGPGKQINLKASFKDSDGLGPYDFTMALCSNIVAPDPGFTPSKPAFGKITPVPLSQIVFHEPGDGPCEWDGIDFLFKTEEPIHFSWYTHTPEIKFSIRQKVYNDRGFQCWWPWGSARIWGKLGDEDWYYVTQGAENIDFGGIGYQYCFNNLYFNAEYDQFKISTRNTTFLRSYGGSMIGNGACPPADPVCNTPQLGEVCLWFLERDKPAKNYNPLGCRI